MVCDVCNMCHGPRFHGHGSPEFTPVRTHGAQKNERRLMLRFVVATFSKTPLHDDINGAASCQRQRHWTSFDIMAPGAGHCVACTCGVPPIHSTTGLVFAVVLEERAFAANVPRPFESTATSRCSWRRRSTSTFFCCFSPAP